MAAGPASMKKAAVRRLMHWSNRAVARPIDAFPDESEKRLPAAVCIGSLHVRALRTLIMDLRHGEATGDRDTVRASYRRLAMRIVLCCPSTVPEKAQGCRTWRFVSPT